MKLIDPYLPEYKPTSQAIAINLANRIIYTYIPVVFSVLQSISATRTLNHILPAYVGLVPYHTRYI